MAAKTVRVIFCKRSEGDSRDTASDVRSVLIPQAGAVRRATLAELVSDAEWHNATGHGITIVYESGRRRNIRAYA